jgi:hypothetical protein
MEPLSISVGFSTAGKAEASYLPGAVFQHLSQGKTEVIEVRRLYLSTS